jgi:hypothetical protein
MALIFFKLSTYKELEVFFCQDFFRHSADWNQFQLSGLGSNKTCAFWDSPNFQSFWLNFALDFFLS